MKPEISEKNNKVYIIVLDQVPDHMVPVLVAHSILGAHFKFYGNNVWNCWLKESFRKCVVSLPKKVFDRLPTIIPEKSIYFGHENKTLGGIDSCAVILPMEEYPKEISFAKLWSPTTFD